MQLNEQCKSLLRKAKATCNMTGDQSWPEHLRTVSVLNGPLCFELVRVAASAAANPPFFEGHIIILNEKYVLLCSVDAGF